MDPFLGEDTGCGGPGTGAGYTWSAVCEAIWMYCQFSETHLDYGR